MTKQNMLRATGLMLVLALSSIGLMATRGEDPENIKRLMETRECNNCSFQDAKMGSFDARLASLKNADFRGALLYGANFQGADLTGAQFGGADLSAANLALAKGASLAGATTNSYTTCPDGSAGPCR